ncbi:MAG: UBP-type zinc finger domain-containing protein [Acidobacteriaceae bacterium]
MAALCSHVNSIKLTSTTTHVCEDCVKVGDRWVHLRLCLECGHVGCCDSSKNKHATKHFHGTKHPLMRSIEPGEAWVWCYVDNGVVGEIERSGFVAYSG